MENQAYIFGIHFNEAINVTNNNFLWTVLVKTIKLCCLYGCFGSNAFEDLNFAKLFIELKVDLFIFFSLMYLENLYLESCYFVNTLSYSSQVV